MTNTEFTIERNGHRNFHLRMKSTALDDLGQKIERAAAEVERESADFIEDQDKGIKFEDKWESKAGDIPSEISEAK